MKKILTLLTFLIFSISSYSFAQDYVRATKYYAGHGCGWRTADGSHINNARVNNGTDRWIAVSKDLYDKGYKFGTKVKIESTNNTKINGIWIVKDRMGPRARNSIDLLMTRENSKGFSNEKVKITIIK